MLLPIVPKEDQNPFSPRHLVEDTTVTVNVMVFRHAKEVCLTRRCHRCGPQSDVPQHRLYAISHGYALHVDYEHCRDAGSNGPLRAFNPCAICCTADDRLVMTCLEGLS